MKAYLAVGASLLMVMGGEAMGDCGMPAIDAAALQNLLVGNTVCIRKGSDWESQEEHMGSSGDIKGDLWDFKKGKTDKMDPRKKLGEWEIIGNTIKYTYTAFGPAESYTYTVHDNQDGTYDFCSGITKSATGTIKTGTEVGC